MCYHALAAAGSCQFLNQTLLKGSAYPAKGATYNYDIMANQGDCCRLCTATPSCSIWAYCPTSQTMG